MTCKSGLLYLHRVVDVDFYAQGNITEIIAFPFGVSMFYSLLPNLVVFNKTIPVNVWKETLLSRHKCLKVLLKQEESICHSCSLFCSWHSGVFSTLSRVHLHNFETVCIADQICVWGGCVCRALCVCFSVGWFCVLLVGFFSPIQLALLSSFSEFST